MFIKLLIISIILVAIVMLTLGVKLLFDPKAEFSGHTCAFEFEEGLDKNNACSKCQLKELADCSEDKNSQIKAE